MGICVGLPALSVPCLQHPCVHMPSHVHIFTHTLFDLPWFNLQSSDQDFSLVQQAREALMACTQQLTIFVPNELLGRLILVFQDTIGFDDLDPSRYIRQMKLEEQLQHMVLLLPRAAGTMASLQAHMERSPFIQRLVLSRTTRTAAPGPPPKLSAVIFPWALLPLMTGSNHSCSVSLLLNPVAAWAAP